MSLAHTCPLCLLTASVCTVNLCVRIKATCLPHFRKLVRRCFGQCLVLAVPGVALGTLIIASFAHYVLPYDFGWPLALAFGSVLSATDPVAVVALLKELGEAHAAADGILSLYVCVCVCFSLSLSLFLSLSLCVYTHSQGLSCLLD